MGVYQKNGYFGIDYRLSNGKRKREKVGTSKTLAINVLRKRKLAIAEGKYLDIDRTKKVKLGDFINLFIENYSKPNKVSWEDDVTRLTGFAQFLGRDVYLSAVTPYHIEQFKKHKLQEVKPSTVNRYLTIAKTMFNKAIEWDNLKDNPLKRIKFFKEDNERTRFLEKEEIARLLDVSDDYLRAVLITALNTGVRYGEPFSIKWADVDLIRNIVFINKTKNKTRRVIPINSLLKKTLFSLKEQSKGELVFPNKNIRKPFEKALKTATINKFRFHDLRHTFASHLVMNSVDLMTIKELLGHKTIRMTLRYSHLSENHKARAVEVLGDKMDTFWTPGEDSAKRDKTVSALTH